jgi:UDP-N-acetylglucosamine 2-epimerase (non-hydrolysing)
MMTKRILLVYGTRPEAIKLAPVVRELARRGQSANAPLAALICATAQHRQLLDDVHALFGITPDFDLDLMQPNQGLVELTARALIAVSQVIRDARPHAVVVQGDTTSAMAGALAAFYGRVPVAHVEAGLRTRDLAAPFPEEMNRQVIGRLARWHFAPTPDAQANLLAEGIDAGAIEVTGNTSIDALRQVTAERLSQAPPELLPGVGERLLLVTAHRRESFGEGFLSICSALRTIVTRFPDVRVVYPVHPNPNVRGPVEEHLGGEPRIQLVAPLPYGKFVALLGAAWVVLTDSGGLQEEAPGLGKPVLVMRDSTERPEPIAAGTAVLVGTDAGRIVAAVARLHDDPAAYAAMATAKNPFGDGHAATRIVARLEHDLGADGVE